MEHHRLLKAIHKPTIKIYHQKMPISPKYFYLALSQELSNNIQEVNQHHLAIHKCEPIKSLLTRFQAPILALIHNQLLLARTILIENRHELLIKYQELISDF